MRNSTRVFWLDDAPAASAERAGAKAANLARATRHDLPVLPGFVIPVRQGPDATWDLGEAWDRLTTGGRPLVVRSSSTLEDGAVSSMAGRFVSVLDVDGWTRFLAAVDEVRASASGPDTMAVLVQPQLDAVVGGVMFGADPIDGRTDRVIVSAAPGGPQALVGGEVNGTRYALTRRGRLVSVEHESISSGPAEGEGPLTRLQLRALAGLAARAASVFGGPQDVEFAFGKDGRLWLLQSRPVTALAPPPPRRASLLGPGPVAETLPDPLSPLEEDLWLAPLDRGLGEALATAGIVSRRALRKRPTVVSVGGRAAADLGRLGAAPGRRRRSWARLINPVPAVRRLAVSWRVGRLRAELPALAAQTATTVDADLAAVPPLQDLTETELAAALRWTRATLTSLHGLEALTGSLLTGTVEGTATAAAQGLAALSEARVRGLDDTKILLDNPAVLALIPPSIGTSELPPTNGNVRSLAGMGPLGPREALRLRIRWVQELGARLAREAAARLVADGALDRPERIRVLRFEELVAAFEETTLPAGSLPADLERRHAPPHTAPLPAAFRLAADRIVADRITAGSAPSGDGAHPAGGGRGSGPVHTGPDTPPDGAVLVVRTLAPSLAIHLPSLAGIVAETGSPLSHLAILARELGVPTVVGMRGALDRFPPGTQVLVDGDTGTVEALHARQKEAA